MSATLDRDIMRHGFQSSMEDAIGDRLDRLIAEAHSYVDQALESCAGYELTGVVCLFSGGDDSTTLAHLMRDRVTHYLHANTQVGAEPTRQYVRDTVAAWNVPLLEREPSGHTYEDLVLRRARSVSPRAKYEHVFMGGFPGANDHRVIFGAIKGKALDDVAAMLCPNGRRQRVIYLGGRRASESQARWARAQSGQLTPVSRRRAVVSVNPLLNWTKLDLNDYRRRFRDLPSNPIAAFMHKSMECACGCFATQGELDFTAACLPSLAEYLMDLQQQVQWTAKREDWDINPRRLCWGWSGGKCPRGDCNI